MITAGIDCGSKNTKVVLMKEGNILSTASVLSGFDQEESAEQALNSALEKAGIKRDEVKHITATGAGMEAIKFSNDTITTITADARGTYFLFPSARTIIDIGAEEGLVVKIDDQGKVKDFGINEKCAAGAGAFIEAMSRALEIDIENMGELSLKSTKQIPMNAQCTRGKGSKCDTPSCFSHRVLFKCKPGLLSKKIEIRSKRSQNKSAWRYCSK